MQNLTSTLGRLTVVLAGALALGSCNRAEYATLPRSASYLGSTTIASVPRHAAPIAAPAVIAVSPAPVAGLPAAPVAAATIPAAPVAKAVAPASAAAALAVVAKAEAPLASPAPAKLNLVQRMALAKVTKKLDKLAAQAPQMKKHDATASTARIDGNLRTGIILLLIGLLVGIFSGLIGTIIALIGVVFIILWLLDSL